MTTRVLWAKLALSKNYRKQFVSAQAKRAFAFQLRAILKKRRISQIELAERSGLTQGVISRAADPNYGKLTTTVIVKIANGLDMAYLGILVPFSEATKWHSSLSEESVQVPTFEEEEELSEAPASSSTAEAAAQGDKHLGTNQLTGAKNMGSPGASGYGGAAAMGMHLVNREAA